MARRVSRARFVRPAPKTKIWIGVGVDEITLVTNTIQLLTVLNAAALALRPFTILRTRLEINLRTDQSAAAEGLTGAYGEIVVKESASGIGVTALPAPLTDIDADFFVWQGMTAPFELNGTGISSSWQPGFRYTVDSKAMRKIGTTDDIVTMSEIRAQGGGLLNVEGRRLIQLH